MFNILEKLRERRIEFNTINTDKQFNTNVFSSHEFTEFLDEEKTTFSIAELIKYKRFSRARNKALLSA